MDRHREQQYNKIRFPASQPALQIMQFTAVAGSSSKNERISNNDREIIVSLTYSRGRCYIVLPLKPLFFCFIIFFLVLQNG